MWEWWFEGIRAHTYGRVISEPQHQRPKSKTPHILSPPKLSPRSTLTLKMVRHNLITKRSPKITKKLKHKPP